MNYKELESKMISLYSSSGLSESEIVTNKRLEFLSTGGYPINQLVVDVTKRDRIQISFPGGIHRAYIERVLESYMEKLVTKKAKDSIKQEFSCPKSGKGPHRKDWWKQGYSECECWMEKGGYPCIEKFLQKTGMIRVHDGFTCCPEPGRYHCDQGSHEGVPTLDIQSYFPLTHSQRVFLLDFIMIRGIEDNNIIVDDYSKEQSIKRQLRLLNTYSYHPERWR